MNATNWEAIVIGGSAGALQALSRILPRLPADYPLPILIVVHLPPERGSVLAEVLQQKCRLRVSEAEDKQPIAAGAVYFAPPDYHLLVEEDRRLSLSWDEPHLFSRPSIDVLFESAADVFAERLIGIILSGANSDGALGLKKVAAEGGLALIQSPEHTYARAMPVAAMEECPSARVLSADEITDFLLSLA